MTEHFETPGITAHQQTYGIALAEDFIRLAHNNDIITFSQLRKLRVLLAETYPTPTYEDVDVERTILRIVFGEGERA
jgi:hypothetical protein